MSRKYDIGRLRVDLRETAGEISTLKKHMRRSNYNPSWQEHSRLRALKLQATKLCCLRAHHRGKMHLPMTLSPMEETHIAELEPRYRLEEKIAA